MDTLSEVYTGNQETATLHHAVTRKTLKTN